MLNGDTSASALVAVAGGSASALSVTTATLAGGQNETDAIQLDVKLGGTALATGIDIPLELDLPGFALNVNGGLALEIGWSLGSRIRTQCGRWLLPRHQRRSCGS